MKKKTNLKSPRKHKQAHEPLKKRVSKEIGLPALIEPTIHDINDELFRLDSFAYSRYNS
jgi:hypothetical protein